MASSKMLIDASHPEETRVAVVRGNRIEEFDFESQEKQQLRGNIYLAKVTRVEPSLQAAFVDYGGNRHGFLAFSEIHPDYYQIPVADRQALLEEEARQAQESSDDDDDQEPEELEVPDTPDDLSADDEADVDDEKPAEKPKKARTPRRRRSTKKASDEADSVDATDVAEVEKPTAEAEDGNAEASAETSESDDDQEKKPKRRTTRRKAPAKKATKAATKDAPEDDAATEAADSGDAKDGDGDEAPKTISAAIDVEMISEELPEDDGSDDDAASSDGDGESGSDDQPKAEEKPKRRTTRRTSRKKKTEPEATEQESVEASATADEASETVESEKTAKPEKDDDGEASESTADDEGEETAPKSRAKRRSPRRGSRRSRAKDSLSDDENGNGSDNGEAAVEAVGQEDALEEVPVRRRHRRQYKIQEVIKRRQVLLIQVVKEERGNKGAALTTYLSLAGRYSVLMPNTARGGGISRKITNASDRKRLKGIASGLDVPQGMGVILRTAGASRTSAEIERDFEYLMRLWQNVRDTTLSSSAPCLVYEEGSLIKRSIRDLYNKDISEILVAGEDGYNEAKAFMKMLMPSHADNVKLYNEPQAMFAKYGVESHLEKMLAPQVTLKSGGYLVINQTEALVAIDVNSGRSTREHSIEDTALQTNLEAAEEVARQLRLRDLAGLIVIDFIDMEEKRNNRSVEKKLKDCLKNDRARIQVGRISHFGLMEMSRQRMRASVLESTMDVCPHCGGMGHVRSDSAIALHVFRAIEEHVARNRRNDAIVKTTPSIALYILNHKRQSLSELELRYGIQILIEADATISGQDFAIEKGEAASGRAPANDQKQTSMGDGTGFDSQSVDSDEDDDGRKKRKRRRGKRRSDRDEGENQATDGKTEDGDEPAEAQKADGDSDGETEEGGSRRRRRGKRGGQRNRGSNAEAKAEAASDQDVEVGSAPAEDKADADTTEAGEADKAPAKRNSRPRGRKPKADVEAEVEAKADADAASAKETETSSKAAEVTTEEVAEEAAEEKPATRNTRRKTPTETTEPAEPVVTVKSVDPEAGTEMVEEAPKPKKKGGWWSRGGGFFS